jgi:hypothetical protein
MALGEVDSESVVVILKHGTTGRTPMAPIRLTIQNDRVTRIAWYVHCPSILQTATSVLTADASEPPESPARIPDRPTIVVLGETV